MIPWNLHVAIHVYRPTRLLFLPWWIAPQTLLIGRDFHQLPECRHRSGSRLASGSLEPYHHYGMGEPWLITEDTVFPVTKYPQDFTNASLRHGKMICLKMCSGKCCGMMLQITPREREKEFRIQNASCNYPTISLGVFSRKNSTWTFSLEEALTLVYRPTKLLFLPWWIAPQTLLIGRDFHQLPECRHRSGSRLASGSLEPYHHYGMGEPWLITEDTVFPVTKYPQDFTNASLRHGKMICLKMCSGKFCGMMLQITPRERERISYSKCKL